MLNYWTLRLIPIKKFNRWLITHFCPVILARIDSAGLSWTILTKNKGHISARIYLARVISAFVGWIISAKNIFARNILAKFQPRLAWISEGRFLHINFWPPHNKVSRTQLFQQGHYLQKMPKAFSHLEYLSRVFGEQTLAKIPPRSAQILPTSFATWALGISCLC